MLQHGAIATEQDFVPLREERPARRRLGVPREVTLLVANVWLNARGHLQPVDVPLLPFEIPRRGSGFQEFPGAAAARLWRKARVDMHPRAVPHYRGAWGAGFRHFPRSACPTIQRAWCVYAFSCFAGLDAKRGGRDLIVRLATYSAAGNLHTYFFSEDLPDLHSEEPKSRWPSRFVFSWSRKCVGRLGKAPGGACDLQPGAWTGASGVLLAHDAYSRYEYESSPLLN